MMNDLTPIVDVPPTIEGLIEAYRRGAKRALNIALMRIQDEPFFPNSDGPHHGNAAAFRDYERRIERIIEGVRDA